MVIDYKEFGIDLRVLFQSIKKSTIQIRTSVGWYYDVYSIDPKGIVKLVCFTRFALYVKSK